MGKAIVVVSLLAACASEPPKQTAQQYFARNTYVVMNQACASNTSGCHTVDAADPSVPTGPLKFVGLPTVDEYDLLVQKGYTGAFDDNAPLLTAHAQLQPPISVTTVEAIEHWFELERAERGL
jgi:hypothetical protein